MSNREAFEMLESKNLCAGCEICALFDDIYKRVRRFSGWTRHEVEYLTGTMLRDKVDQVNVTIMENSVNILIRTKKYGLNLDYKDFIELFSVTKND